MVIKMCDALDIKFQRRIARCNGIKMSEVRDAHICVESPGAHGVHGAVFVARGAIALTGLTPREVNSIHNRKRDPGLADKLRL